MDSDDQSLVPVFQMVLEGLGHLARALETAMHNYDAADEAAIQYLGKLKD